SLRLSRSDLPDPLVDQRDPPAAGIEAGRLELRAADHDVEVDGGVVQTAGGRFRTRTAETAAECDVRRSVLVEQGVVVDAAGLADARGGVDECNLSEPPPHPVGVDEACDEIAVVVGVGFEPDEPSVRELPAEPVDQTTAEG